MVCRMIKFGVAEKIVQKPKIHGSKIRERYVKEKMKEARREERMKEEDEKDKGT